jgi:glycosyltransferase involved in cell wall biosynthesis
MPKILYLITEDWFFASHFLPMARAARDAGLDVSVATRIRGRSDEIRAEGIDIISYDTARGGVGLPGVAREFRQTLRIIKQVQPDIVHCIALRPVVIGGLAARAAGVKGLILAPTGLGRLWTENALSFRIGRKIVQFIVGRLLRNQRTYYLFENRDDPLEFGLDPADAHVTIVGGAGVDPEKFPMSPEPPAPPVKFAVVARMIRPKGIFEAVEAIRRASTAGLAVELNLYGAPDVSNRSSIPEDLLQQLSSEPGIQWHGHTDDIARVWREHHAGLFLTYYREGMPRALIEAAAAGRPVVTTNMPGCRELVRDGQEGLLVPVRDVEAAYGAITRLSKDAELRVRLGAAARARVRAGFTEEIVGREVGALYRKLSSRV